ncbi:probable phosphoglycerate mutase [Franzmannia pantelleriensis]|uniref:Probable phosphoglycerate mutase n=1 Tax=Franzmannia pantelleriensis TaxID=48727 RepID=A0A1G9T512_9GAMM|nr:histidine phosphatase family protein [Halomonas pantelleriensis]SDM42717.1 probable phosphoglycerate mutase [Halomonas pantelleriensis]
MSNTLPPSAPSWRNRYLLMRHGHSQANQQGLIISHPDNGLEAYGLSPLGQAQLEQVVSEWHWPTPTRILHSDFLRTTETAARVARHFGLAMMPDVRLRERHFGILERQSDQRYPTVWALDAKDPTHSEHGVESVISVAQRLQTVVAELEVAHRDETILLVSHGDPLQILLTALAKRPLSAHRDRQALTPASITPLG